MRTFAILLWMSRGTLLRVNANSGYFKVENSYMTGMFRNVGNEIVTI